ncbi:MAG: flagellin [Alphaproteobacteria bacterium]
MVISNVSFLGQSLAQTSRLKDLNVTLADLTRQLTTRKVHEDMSGLGFAAQAVQRYRMNSLRLTTYLDNISGVTTRIKEMDQAMASSRTMGEQLIEGLTIAVHGGSEEIPNLAALARDALTFLQDLTNLNIDGRYLFSGSSTTTQPFIDDNLLNANFQQEMTDWLNGTNSTAQLLANVDGFTTTDLGFDPALSASGNVAVRVDEHTEIDYTVKADSNGIPDLMRALAFMSNMVAPGGGDVPTDADLQQVLTQILAIARRGIEDLDTAATSLGSRFNLIKSLEEGHTQDRATLANLIGEKEDADTTEVVAQIQSLQTQLQASYQVTSIISQLSLVNFI